MGSPTEGGNRAPVRLHTMDPRRPASSANAGEATSKVTMSQSARMAPLKFSPPFSVRFGCVEMLVLKRGVGYIGSLWRDDYRQTVCLSSGRRLSVQIGPGTL